MPMNISFPAGAEIPAGGYFVVGEELRLDYEMDFQFKVDAKARLFAPDGETLVDEADWEEGDAPAGTSWGRFPNGVGAFQMLTTPTQGKPNAEPEPEQEETDTVESGDGEGDEGVEPSGAQAAGSTRFYPVDGEGANCWWKFSIRERKTSIWTDGM